MEPADAELLARAVRLALDNAYAGQLPFGALVVRDGTVLATGVNTVLSDHDPTAHAEAAAVRAACRNLATLQLPDATVFSSCEPCAMCLSSAFAAGVERILYAVPNEQVPDLGVPFPKVVAEMQLLWRDLEPDRLEYVPTPGADEPFARFLAGTG